MSLNEFFWNPQYYQDCLSKKQTIQYFVKKKYLNVLFFVNSQLNDVFWMHEKQLSFFELIECISKYQKKCKFCEKGLERRSPKVNGELPMMCSISLECEFSRALHFRTSNPFPVKIKMNRHSFCFSFYKDMFAKFNYRCCSVSTLVRV